MRFQNKVVIVTGGSSGIGAATALQLAREGGNVVIVGRNLDKLNKVQETSEKDGNKVFTINADVTKDDEAKRIIDGTLNEYRKIDVLVNNAGILRFDSILGGNLFENYDEVMNTNLRAAMFLTTLAAPHLIRTKGNIVNVSSVSSRSFQSEYPVIVYNVTKAALEHFSRGAAVELGPHGVRVNTVTPGPVTTDLVENAGLATVVDHDKRRSTTVLNRESTAEECAKVIAFLASGDAVGVTGSDYVVDNGYLIKR